MITTDTFIEFNVCLIATNLESRSFPDLTLNQNRQVGNGINIVSGLYILLDSNKSKLRSHWFWGLLTIVWLSVLFGFFSNFNDTLGGTVGYEINSFLQDYLGIIGTVSLLLFVLIVFLAIKFKLTAQTFIQLFLIIFTKK